MKCACFRKPRPIMGSSHDNFIKYPRTPHVFGSKGIQLARERCRELLRSGQPFAFSATNLLRQTRQRWLDLFADYGSRIEIVYIEPSLPVILAQNKRRERAVPENVIRELADKCEPPTWAKAHRLIIVETR